jgi:lysophospholipase L1-like esterase
MPADRRRPTAVPALPATLLLILLVGLLLSACSGSSDAPGWTGGVGTGSSGARITTYVALGDSYTAAPFVPVTSLASGCLRSDHNYPALLARRLGARLHDVSCSGATTHDVLHGQVVSYGDQRSTLRPQLAAVRPGTDLVTVGIGGNDGGLFGALVHGCLTSGEDATSCEAEIAGRLGDPARLLAGTERRVARVLRAVHAAAPHARVVLVGYPRLLSTARACPTMRVPTRDRPLLAHVEAQLDRALAGASRQAGTAFLDLRRASRGHEICSAHPWVNGAVTDQQRAAAFHPFAVEQHAVADALRGLLRATR